jgi:hypothetical protein
VMKVIINGNAISGGRIRFAFVFLQALIFGAKWE